MGFSESYFGKLRKKVGHDLVIVPGGRIVLEDVQGRILLQRRSDFGIWGLPAGSPEEGESASESIRREALEETGLTVIELGCFGHSSSPEHEVFTYPNGDVVHAHSLCFFSRRWEGELSTEDDETLDLRFFHPDALPEMMARHRRTIAMYRRYKETGEFQLG